MAGTANPVGGGAAADLGLGTMLGDQQKNETEEQRKKRLLGLTPMAAQSPGVASLFGMGGMGGGISGRGY